MELRETASELKRLAGLLPRLYHFGMCWAIRQLIGVNESVGEESAGLKVRSYLAARIDLVEEPVQLWGRQYSPEVFRRAARLLLGIEGEAMLGYARRNRVIALLDVRVGNQTWRKYHEREFVAVLAELIA